MPRKPILYTSEFPYHVYARTNNREPFPINQEILWEIILETLERANDKFSCAVHDFVLMRNHYHMLISTDPDYDLGVVMQFVQKLITDQVNVVSGKINHVFGGRYKASLITNDLYYQAVFKYVYQNPIRAGICGKVEHYQFSSVHNYLSGNTAPFEKYIEDPSEPKTLDWINETFDEELREKLRWGLSKTEFRIPRNKNRKKYELLPIPR